MRRRPRFDYPVLMRPSYVLGGQNMIIAFSDDDVREYMAIILSQDIENPVLIDKYLMGIELEVDAICDGEDILIPGIMEHIERAGIHSGDSIAVYPAWNIGTSMRGEDRATDTRDLALALKTKGLVNIQYLIYAGRAVCHRGQPPLLPHHPLHQQGDGRAHGGSGHPGHAGRKAQDMGYGTGLYQALPLCGGEGAGVLL